MNDELQGTFACSVCGVAEPHWHDVALINRRRVEEGVLRPAFESALFDLMPRMQELRVSAYGMRHKCFQKLGTGRETLELPKEYFDGKVEAMWQLFLRAHYAASAGVALPEVTPEQWRPMETAPTNDTMVRLLVDYRGEDACHPLDDAEIAETIGTNTDSNTGLSEGWKFAGWSWEQDCFTQGQGKPIGWLPFAPVPAGVAAAPDNRTRPLTDQSQPWTSEHCKAYPRRAAEEINWLRGQLAARADGVKGLDDAQR